MADKENVVTESSYDYIKKSFELRNLKLYKEAIEMLYKALSCEDISSRDVEITSQIGDLYFLLKNYDRALEQYEIVLEEDKVHRHTLSQVCKIFIIQKKYQEALTLVEDLCRYAPVLESYIEYFKIMYELEMYDKMAAVYDSISDEFKKNEEILYTMSLMNSSKKQEYLTEVVEINPRNYDAQFDLGVVYYNNGELEKALEHFEIAVQNKKNARAHNYLGLIHQSFGHYYEAIEQFYEATKTDKINAEYFYNLSKAYIDINWLDEAETAIKKSLRLMQLSSEPDVDLGSHYFILAWINNHKGNYKNAILNLNLIEKNSPVTKYAKILRYAIDFALGDVVSTKIKLESLYKNEKENGNYTLYSTLGKIYKELKMHEKAIDVYQTGLKFYPKSYDFLVGITEAYIDTKDYENAIKYCDILSQNYPTSANSHNCYARIYYRKKQYKEALDELEKLVALDKNNAESYYFMGLISNDTNNPDLARSYIEIALGLNPVEAKYYAQMARAYELSGKYNEAMLFIKEAIDIAPSDLYYYSKAKDYCIKLGDLEGASFYESHISRAKEL